MQLIFGRSFTRQSEFGSPFSVIKRSFLVELPISTTPLAIQLAGIMGSGNARIGANAFPFCRREPGDPYQKRRLDGATIHKHSRGGSPEPSRFGRQASLPVTAGGHLACRFLPDKLEACRPGQARSLTSIAVNRPYHLFFRELRSALYVEKGATSLSGNGLRVFL